MNLLAGSTYALARLGRLEEARGRLDAAFARLKQLQFYPAEKIEPGSESEEAVRALADYEAARGNVPRAMSVYQELLSKIQPAQSGLAPGLEDAVHLATIYQSAADLYRRTGQADVADALDAKRRDLWRQWGRTLPDNSFVRRQLQAAILP